MPVTELTEEDIRSEWLSSSVEASTDDDATDADEDAADADDDAADADDDAADADDDATDS